MATKFFKATSIKLGSLTECKGWQAVARIEGKQFVVYTRANGKLFKAESDVMEEVADTDLTVYQSDLFSYMEASDLGIYNFATYQERDANGVAEFISYDCEPCTEEEFLEFLKK